MLAAIGLGSNLRNPPHNVRAAIRALRRLGDVRACSQLYSSKPWGKTDQPDFCNAVVLLETQRSARELLEDLQSLERRLGRTPGERWGPRVIDLDILTYGEMEVDEPDLQIPHPRLYERAFALVPLAEVDARFQAAVAALPPGETVALMPEDEQPTGEFSAGLSQRVRTLAAAFRETDLIRLRIEDEFEDAIEIRRRPVPAGLPAPAQPQGAVPPGVPANLHPIKADLVGVFRFSRPTVTEGEMLDGDRELAYVDALGIRNPVRSLGGGRVVSVLCHDGEPVEYGQVLFEIDRG
ncbi:MAG TPA: 2-amino-4-hydroxy-6-hydroxymethyldihydropteridine diphosphokinase [Candidatus Baltobacteraceae bacterium]|nr:2-amino-4-hydroxy-6-hydroxymethyldihydropteridine diphosphokinase [Candidatus Baltobacteraceae bacterium]